MPACSYKFRVIAVNDNFRIESDWTTPCKPDAKKEKRHYQQEKNDTIDEIMKIRRRKIQEEKKKERTATMRGASPRSPRKSRKGSGRKGSGLVKNFKDVQIH